MERIHDAILYQGNCFDYLPEVQTGSVDLVLCDLPYGCTQNPWDVPLDMDALWREWNRVCKPTTPVVLFAQDMFTARLMMSNPQAYRYKWVWDKHHVSGFLNANKQPLRCMEDVLVFYRKQCPYYPIMRTGRYRQKGSGSGSGNYGKFDPTKSENDQYFPTQLLSVPREEGTVHPTQKPVALLEYLIKTYTQQGGAGAGQLHGQRVHGRGRQKPGPAIHRHGDEPGLLPDSPGQNTDGRRAAVHGGGMTGAES